MWPLIRDFLHDLFLSKEAARGYLRGISSALAVLVAQAATLLAALPPEKIQALLGDPKQLALMLIPSILMGFAGLVRAGDKTETVLKRLNGNAPKPPTP